MDTSETYIKMCSCPEIQKNKLPFNGINNLYGNGNRRTGIWLPRQDQIQEMLGIKTHMRISPFLKFIDWAETYYPENVNNYSMEEIWLAFYMYEKHKKIWNGKAWQ